MKCRYIEDVSNTSINVTTSRSGVVSLGCSLCFDTRIILFAICTQDFSGDFRWLTLWTRGKDGGKPRLNPLLDTLHPSLSRLDAEIVENIGQFVSNELDFDDDDLCKIWERFPYSPMAIHSKE